MGHTILNRAGLLSLAVGCLLIGESLFAQSVGPRKWKDLTGKFEIEATYVSFEGGKVTLKQTDGEVVEIPISQLSPADVQYVLKEKSGVSLSIPGVSPDEEAKSATGPTAAAIRWAGVPELSLPAKNNWGAIRIEPPVVKKAKSSRLPNTRDFVFEKFTNFVAGRGFAIAGYNFPEPHSFGKKGTTRLVRVNLESGKVEGTIITDGIFSLMDVSPSGEELVMRVESPNAGKSTDLEIWRPAGKTVERKKAFAPFVDGDQFFQQVEMALLGVNGRLVVTSYGERAGIIDVETGNPIATTPKAHGACLSPDRKYAAILGDSLFIVDLASGETLASLPVNLSSGGVVAFSPDGKRLAAQSGLSLTVWDLSTGETYREEVLPGGATASNERFAWTSPNHILVGETLFDLENHLPLWRYSGVDNSLSYGASTLVLTHFGQQTPVLTAVTLPHPAAVAMARQALASGNLFAVRPGTSVSVDVSAIPDAGEQARAKSGLESRLIAAGLKPVTGGPIVLKASVETSSSQRVFRRLGTLDAPESVTVTEYIAKVEMLVDGKSAWQNASRTGGALSLMTTGNESLQDAASKSSRPNYGFFSEVKLPQYVLRPGGAGHLGADSVAP
ncbi:hypothetical protein Pan44_06500 [Caulifigura coniformis]|uniref:SLA1 homology domain-containing protein n=1 Tax=Caulifigura coniformis TaxID=2527983 RepID=A0A517S934_9PLAN|nr:SHD1 domain-containing protein [Caulifigura coniformis]QDT52638.1 hypothetical protein Pan44_06500 [Caulifigura coniformis]